MLLRMVQMLQDAYGKLLAQDTVFVMVLQMLNNTFLIELELNLNL